MKPVFGLMVRYRAYQCLICDHKQDISTNHTDKCMDHCRGCSWRSAFKKDVYHFVAGTNRPFKYIGSIPTVKEWNPNSGVEFVDLTRITQADLDDLRINDREPKIIRNSVD